MTIQKQHLVHVMAGFLVGYMLLFSSACDMLIVGSVVKSLDYSANVAAGFGSLSNKEIRKFCKCYATGMKHLGFRATCEKANHSQLSDRYAVFVNEKRFDFKHIHWEQALESFTAAYHICPTGYDVEKKLEFVQSVLEARKSWTQGDDKKAEQFVQHASSIEQDHSKTLDRVLNEMARNERMGHK